MSKELKHDMDMCTVRMELEGELRRIQAIKDCLNKGDTDHITQGLDLSMDSLNKALEILKQY